jgi:hypothetical protein
MAQESASPFDPSQLAAELGRRAEQERAAGGYPDDLSCFELETRPGSIVEGFDLESREARVRFRPELGFSSKPVVGPAITLVKRFYLRLLFVVLDDLARQTDNAIRRVEAALSVEVAKRERLEWESERKIRELEGEIRLLQDRTETDPP